MVQVFSLYPYFTQNSNFLENANYSYDIIYGRNVRLHLAYYWVVSAKVSEGPIFCKSPSKFAVFEVTNAWASIAPPLLVWAPNVSLESCSQHRKQQLSYETYFDKTNGASAITLGSFNFPFFPIFRFSGIAARENFFCRFRARYHS